MDSYDSSIMLDSLHENLGYLEACSIEYYIQLYWICEIKQNDIKFILFDNFISISLFEYYIFCLDFKKISKTKLNKPKWYIEISIFRIHDEKDFLFQNILSIRVF